MGMRNRSSIIWGLIFIVIGMLTLLDRLDIIRLSWNLVWPIFILGIGIIFHILYLFSNSRDAGVLVPGGIFVTYGILFYICVLFGWRWMSVLWPLFILGPGIGLFELYLFGNHDKGLLIPVTILSVIGGLLLANNLSDLGMTLIFPLFLIIIGVIVIVSNLFGRN